MKALARVYDDPAGLACKLVMTADWRLRKSDELCSLAEWVVSDEARPLVARYDAMWARMLARGDDLSDACQAENEALKDIDFQGGYESGEDFLRSRLRDEEAPPPLRVVSG